MLSRQDYIDHILDHYDNPRNRGALRPSDIEASGGNPGCGDVVVMFARIEGDRVTEAAFEGEGCTISQAAASILTEEVVGKTLEQIEQMNYEHVIEEMGRDVVSSRTRCATLALTIMRNAVHQYRLQHREPAESR